TWLLVCICDCVCIDVVHDRVLGLHAGECADHAGGEDADQQDRHRDRKTVAACVHDHGPLHQSTRLRKKMAVVSGVSCRLPSAPGRSLRPVSTSSTPRRSSMSVGGASCASTSLTSKKRKRALASNGAASSSAAPPSTWRNSPRSPGSSPESSKR